MTITIKVQQDLAGNDVAGAIMAFNEEGRKIGAVYMHYYPACCGRRIVTEYFVDHDYRRQGIGKALDWAVKASSRNVGYRSLSMVVVEGQRDALRMFEKTGWVMSEWWNNRNSGNELKNGDFMLEDFDEEAPEGFVFENISLNPFDDDEDEDY